MQRIRKSFPESESPGGVLPESGSKSEIQGERRPFADPKKGETKGDTTNIKEKEGQKAEKTEVLTRGA